jgi:hypothetical protein
MRVYLTAVENAFRWSKVDYAVLVKLYGPGASGRYTDALPDKAVQLLDSSSRHILCLSGW